MSAYVIVNVKVTNPVQYQEYVKLASLAHHAYDVKVLARGGTTEILEGANPNRVVILKFPSMEAARNWYNSPQYQRARNARHGASEMNMCIVESID